MKRVQKLMKKKDKKEEELEKLESGFKLYTNGAHKPAEKFTPRYTTAKSSSEKRSFNFIPELFGGELKSFRELSESNGGKTDRVNSAPNAKIRKKWSHTSFTIKTDEGYQIKINGPNCDQACKSDTGSKNQKECHYIELDFKRNDSDNYYSDDFESCSESEEDTKAQSEKDEINDKKLIETVQFSDDSDVEEIKEMPVGKKSRETNNNKKGQIVCELSKKDIKVN